MTPESLRVLVAIAAITAIEIVALIKGKNGTMMRIVIIAIAALAGFSIAELVK